MKSLTPLIMSAALLVAGLVLRVQPALPLETASPLDPPDSPALWVSFSDGLLSVAAKQAPWVKVLNEIGEKTGVCLHYPLSLPGSVTVSFTALPVKQALERLFGPEANLIFRYPEGADAPASLGVPTNVWVLGWGRGGGSDAAQTTAGNHAGQLGPQANTPPADQGRQALEAPAEPDAGTQDTEGDEGLSDQEQINVLVKMTQEQDPELRRQAISALSDSGKGDDTVRSALEAALTDKDASVRASAIQALASRAGPEAMDHLWQALRDPDPEVRIMAIDSVVPNDQSMVLLQKALSDEDGAVRSMAAERLQQALHQGGSDQGRAF